MPTQPDKWQDVIFACDECKLRYDQSSEGICPIHGTEMTVAFPPTPLPETITVKSCPECGSESDKALRSHFGKAGPLDTDVPHCPDCGSTRQAILTEDRELTADERAVLADRQQQRRVVYDRVAAYPAAGE